MTADLLPSNATQLERDLSLSGDVLPKLAAGTERIRTAKRADIPEDVVPWLIYEYGLGEITPYVPDLRQALAEGILWQRLRGTPRAIQIGLGWIDLQAYIEESEQGTAYWADYQLGLDAAPPSLAFINSTIGITRLSSPIRSRLFRVWGGWYDFRRFKLDDHLLSEGSWLCDHTGAYLRDDWPQLSFGREFSAITPSPLAIPESGRTHIDAVLDVYEDRFILSQSLLDEAWHMLQDPGATNSKLHQREYLALAYEIGAATWVDRDWQLQLSWQGTTTVPPRRFAKAGIYLSDGAVLGDTNAVLPARFETELGDGPLLLSEANSATGEGALSEHIQRWEFAEVLERFDRQTATIHELFAPGTEPGLLVSSRTGEHRRLLVGDYFWILSENSYLSETWHSILDSTHTISSTTYLARMVDAESWDPINWRTASNWLAVAAFSTSQTHA